MLNLFGTKIEKLEKILKKTLEKTVKYGNKLIEAYENLQGQDSDKIKSVVEKLNEILEDWNNTEN